MNGVKQEPGFKQDPTEASSPGVYEYEADIYEDDNELSVAGVYDPEAWLLRVDSELWHALANMSDDQEVQVGKLKTWTKADGSVRTQLELNRLLPGLRDVYKDYHVTTTSSNVSNTYSFSEKDLPGYKPGRRTGNAMGGRPGDSGRIQKGKRPRRSIPKQTALQSAFQRELLCLPAETEEYQALKKAKEKLREPEITSGIRTTMAEFNELNNQVKRQQLNSFITMNQKTKRKKEKYVRLPRNEVMDMIFGLFKEYKAWGLRSIRDRLRQPESYLKEILLDIADLQRSGDLVNTYVLKREYSTAPYQSAADAIAPGGDDSDNDDDDAGEMEDVKLEK